MKRYKLKKKYKDILTFITLTMVLYDLIIGAILLYQWRYKNVNGQRPGAVHIKEIFKK